MSVDAARLVRAEIEARGPAYTSLDTKAIREERRGFSQRLADAPARDVVELAVALVERPDVPRFVAYELVQNHAAALASITADDLARLGKGLDSWGAVDAFACYVAGPAWRAGQVPDETIERWTESPDRWWRRAAVVATVPLNVAAQGGGGDAGRTLRIVELLLDDKEDLVVKSISWALRALAKRDAPAVGRFLSSHGDRLPRFVYAEVANVLRGATKTGRPTGSGSTRRGSRGDGSRPMR